MDLNAKKVVSSIEIINLDVEISAKKIIVALIFEIEIRSIHIKMVMINQDI